MKTLTLTTCKSLCLTATASLAFMVLGSSVVQALPITSTGVQKASQSAPQGRVSAPSPSTSQRRAISAPGNPSGTSSKLASGGSSATKLPTGTAAGGVLVGGSGGPTACNDQAFVAAGTFEMGRHVAGGSGDELPIHEVSLAAFQIDKFEVTNQKYVDYLNSALANGLIYVAHGSVYSEDGVTDGFKLFEFQGGSSWGLITFNGTDEFSVASNMKDHPIDCVTWFGACAYANDLSLREGLTPCYDELSWSCDQKATGFRLPTEAEWEFAARGGQVSPFAGGYGYQYPWITNPYPQDYPDGSQANYDNSGNPFSYTTPVGYFDGNQTPSGVDMANGFGLYDMAGNVQEWCGDLYGGSHYASSQGSDPTGPTTGSERVVRGGHWASSNTNPSELRLVNRNSQDPSEATSWTGFRLVRTAHMVPIPAGTFDMGRHIGPGGSDELPVHTVTLGAFSMDKFEVTCEEYVSFLNSALSNGDVVINLDGAVCQATNPTVILCDTKDSYHMSNVLLINGEFVADPGKEDHPMAQVSWFGACAYANALSLQRGLNPCYNETDWSCDTQEEGFRLPTESEWEYAARGGEYLPYTIYPFGDTIDGNQANYIGSGHPFALSSPVGYYDGDQVISGMPVGADMANGFGLYDMSGNAMEWCGDRYGAYSSPPSSNPTGPTTGSTRVLRGGSFYHGWNNLRSAERDHGTPSLRGVLFGFRLVTNTCQ